MLDKIIIISCQGKKLNCNMCSGFSLVRKYFYGTHMYHCMGYEVQICPFFNKIRGILLLSLEN